MAVGMARAYVFPPGLAQFAGPGRISAQSGQPGQQVRRAT